MEFLCNIHDSKMKIKEVSMNDYADNSYYLECSDCKSLHNKNYENPLKTISELIK